MFDRPRSGERALLVHVALGAPADIDEIREFTDLSRSAGARIIGQITGSRDNPDPRFFIGSGKAEEIREQVETQHIELVIFDHSLSPSQERNLEKLLQCRVLDRNGLILDIFAQRARSFEGKLQVELAQLRHLSTRLVRGWTHLERQKGGIGLRGPGETQLETDRRLLNARIEQIKKRLHKVEGQRAQGRRARQRAEVPTVALVGYTNAGKSTLFNSLTDAGVYAEDQLFATLDPTMRRIQLEDGSTVILADTVGFVSRLPHELVAAFKSTLVETVEADLLLHVVDCASHQRQFFIDEVNAVLKEIGAEKVPQILVYNKTDLLDSASVHSQQDESGQTRAAWLSARTGEGIELLRTSLQRFFQQDHQLLDIALDCSQGKLHAQLYCCAQVLDERIDEHGGWYMKIKMENRELQRLKKNNPAFNAVIGTQA